MLSPFPGMDPYIEQPGLWGDFHNSLAAEIRSQLNGMIRPNYFARLIPYVTYETITIGTSNKGEQTYPDLSIFQPPRLAEAVAPYTVAGITPEEPGILPPKPVVSAVEQTFPTRLASVEIRTAIDADLVTVIEILSPVNKRRGHGAYHHYKRKRRKILDASNVHLLEIDLLRGGERPPLARPVPSASYYVMLSRVEERPNVLVWPIQLHEPLPAVPVPLRAPDEDVTLDLGQLVADVYERGAYDLQIDYAVAPPPKLDGAEAAWVQQRVAALQQ